MDARGKNVSSSKDSSDKKFFYKIFACAILFYIFVLIPQGYVEAWNYLVAMPNMIVEQKCLGIVILVFMIIIVYPYLLMVYEKSGVSTYYRYKAIREIFIGIQFFCDFGVILYLSLINAQIIKNYDLWKYLLFVDLVFIICVMFVSSIRIAYEATGLFFEYNTIFSQKKIYRYGENKFKVTENTVISQRKISTVGDDKFDLTLDNDEYEITNGEEIIRMKKLTPYQKEGIKKFVELIREKQNDK